MSGRSKKSKRANSADIGARTSSRGSAAGSTPLASPDGQMMLPLHGREAAPALRSVRAGKGSALMIPVISGPIGSGSFESQHLTSSLGSRLQRLLASRGSILFRLTWKERITPSGRRIFALRASALRTSEIASISWPTPTKNDAFVARHGYMDAARLTAWPSPATPSGGRSVSTEKMYATGKTVDGKKHTASLEHAVRFAIWPTPTAGTLNDEDPNWQERRARAKEKHGNNGFGLNLSMAATLADSGGGAEWIACSDGKARPTQSGIFPLADGVPARLVRLRGYGDAIVPQLAATFIEAFTQILAEQ